jgi:hypothetical protein
MTGAFIGQHPAEVLHAQSIRRGDNGDGQYEESPRKSGRESDHNIRLRRKQG